MIFLFSLAARNLLRNVRRTVISSAAVVFGVALPILGWGLVDGLDENVLRAARTTTVGEVLLRPDAYPTDGHDFPLEEARVVPPELATRLDAAGEWTARAKFSARLVHGADAVRAHGLAYDDATERSVFPRKGWTLDGRWPTVGADETVVGRGLARLLDLKLGDVLVAETRTFPGALNALAFTVVGIVRTENSGLDNLTLWIEMAIAERLLQLDGRRTHVAVAGSRGAADAVALKLEGLGWSTRTTHQECADILAINQIRRAALIVLVFIIMGIAGTGIANTVIMAAYERVREIGTLLALGMKQTEVRFMFLLEGAAMGAVAGLLGAGIGMAAVLYLEANGIALSPQVLEQAGDIPMSATLYTHFSWPPIGIAYSFGVAIATLASIWPAVYASNLNPADAVKAD